MAIDLDGSTRGGRGVFESTWLRAAIRTILALLAFLALYRAQRHFGSFDSVFLPGPRLALDSGAWLSSMGIQALSGLLFGLAAFMPFTRVRYAWSRLLVAAVALAPLAHFWLVFAHLIPRRNFDGWWMQDWFFNPQAQFVSATFVGVAIASGLQPRSEEVGQDGSTEEDRKPDPTG